MSEESVDEFFVRMRKNDPTIIQCNDCVAKNPTWASGSADNEWFSWQTNFTI